jgi:hypothetical protein
MVESGQGLTARDGGNAGHAWSNWRPFDTSGERRDFRRTTTAGAETIYRCESAGGLVFSDRPCAANAGIHETEDGRVTVYDAPPISKRASEPRSEPGKAAGLAQKRAAAHAKHLAKHQATCAKLKESLREVQTRLRTGYGVKEGERLKTRQRQLAERRRTEKCR